MKAGGARRTPECRLWSLLELWSPAGSAGSSGCVVVVSECRKSPRFGTTGVIIF
ncbi:MAG: hypothetical protein ACI9X0_001431 [Kiritimatiellia bacterium]|jgi:hypothetical protein